MHIPWIAVIGPILLVWIASFIVYKLLIEHMDKRFDEIQSWLEKHHGEKKK